VAGGQYGFWNQINTAELYDPLSRNWASVAYMSTIRSYHTASILLDGKVLVTGENENYLCRILLNYMIHQQEVGNSLKA
jgi:hypothetical protein